MKTYALNCLDRIKQYSKRLDGKAILYNKNWEVFNDAGEKEILVFRPNNELLIVRKGIVQRTKWELLSTGSIIIETDSVSYLFNAAFIDNDFLSLQLDGTNECMIMIESETKKKLALSSIIAIDKYLNNTYMPEKINASETIMESTPFEEEDKSITSYFSCYFFALLIALLIIFLIILIIKNY